MALNSFWLFVFFVPPLLGLGNHVQVLVGEGEHLRQEVVFVVVFQVVDGIEVLEIL